MHHKHIPHFWWTSVNRPYMTESSLKVIVTHMSSNLKHQDIARPFHYRTFMSVHKEQQWTSVFSNPKLAFFKVLIRLFRKKKVLLTTKKSNYFQEPDLSLGKLSSSSDALFNDPNLVLLHLSWIQLGWVGRGFQFHFKHHKTDKSSVMFSYDTSNCSKSAVSSVNTQFETYCRLSKNIGWLKLGLSSKGNAS